VAVADIISSSVVVSCLLSLCCETVYILSLPGCYTWWRLWWLPVIWLRWDRRLYECCYHVE